MPARAATLFESPAGTTARRSRAERDCWNNMLYRCRNPKSQAYRHYGGRGISVCDRWSTFANFLADMGSKPSPRHTIERVDNDGNYEPSNCRWATMAEQCKNMRANRVLNIAGTKLILADASRLFGLSESAIRNRLKRGWTDERAALSPLAQTFLPAKDAATGRFLSKEVSA